MLTNQEIFKAYDIRGIYKQDFDDDFAYELGLAYGNFRQQEVLGKKLKIAVGRDMRLSSPALLEKLIQGLLASGVDVVDLALLSTPTFYFAVANYDYDGGILVSASHNPKEYNGFKLVRHKALPIGKNSGLPKIQEIIAQKTALAAKESGKISQNEEVLQAQIEHDLQYADWQSLENLKIVIDPANAMGALYFDKLFEYLLNCDLIKINWELDGTFPNHEADPFKEENMLDLQKKVIETKADLGIATDGDGDRIFFVDETGKTIEPGIIRAILSKIFLQEKPGAKIAYDIRPGRITKDVILENQGIAIETPVGHSLIKKIAIEEDAYFAGESSGHFFLNMGTNGCYETPVIMILKILLALKKSGQKFSEFIKPYKKYFHSGEINSKVKNSELIIQKIKEKFSTGKLNELDGISIEYPDFWFNIRTSNTEPLLRLNLEAKTQEIMQQKRDEILEIIKNFSKSDIR